MAVWHPMQSKIVHPPVGCRNLQEGYHDSWRGHQKNATHLGDAPIESPPKTLNRKPEALRLS